MFGSVLDHAQHLTLFDLISTNDREGSLQVIFFYYFRAREEGTMEAAAAEDPANGTCLGHVCDRTCVTHTSTCASSRFEFTVKLALRLCTSPGSWAKRR